MGEVAKDPNKEVMRYGELTKRLEELTNTENTLKNNLRSDTNYQFLKSEMRSLDDNSELERLRNEQSIWFMCSGLTFGLGLALIPVLSISEKPK